MATMAAEAISSTNMAGAGDAGGDMGAAFAFTVVFYVNGHVSNNWNLNGLVHGDWDMDGLNYWVGFGHRVVLDIMDMVRHWNGYGLLDEDAVCFFLLSLALTTIPSSLATPRGSQSHE